MSFPNTTELEFSESEARPLKSTTTSYAKALTTSGVLPTHTRKEPQHNNESCWAFTTRNVLIERFLIVCSLGGMVGATIGMLTPAPHDVPKLTVNGMAIGAIIFLLVIAAIADKLAKKDPSVTSTLPPTPA